VFPDADRPTVIGNKKKMHNNLININWDP